MVVWSFIKNQMCITQDGIIVSWGLIAVMFALLWLRRIIISRKK